jgi:ABC-type Co2+ transport system permease subunit
MIALLIDVVAAWLVARYTQPGWKQMLAILVGGWLAALADAAVLGFAFGWPPIELLSRLTFGLLVHPPIVGGLAWLITMLLRRMKRRAGTP